MAKNREQIMQEIRTWNTYFSNVNNIPLDPKHKYQDENDIYERLHTYIKGYVENVFGVSTDAKGAFQSVAKDKLTNEQQEWRDAANGKLSVMYSDWYQVALTGDKNGFLPVFEPYNGIDSKQLAKNKEDQENIRDQIDQQLFPAYRALREQFSKRWWFEWIFNHKQYVAERDAVNVMSNLIMSVGGYKKEELDTLYKNNTTVITQEDLYPTKRVKEPKQEEKVVKASKESSLDKFKELDSDEKGFFQQINIDLYKALQGSIINADAARKLTPQHLYLPLSKEAKALCEFDQSYELDKASNAEKYKSDMTARVVETSKKMFEVAFKELSATNLFGEMALNDLIISAQNVTDLILKRMTPVGFQPKVFGNLAKGNYFLDNVDQVRNFIKETAKEKYTDAQITAAVTDAKKQLGTLHRDDRYEMPQIYDIKYRPNPEKLKLEGKALTEALTLVNGENPRIKDAALKNIINQNARKFKEVQAQKGAVYTQAKKDKLLENWIEAEKSLANTYPDYDAQVGQNLVNEAVAAQNGQVPEKVNIDLPKPNSQIVPPVNNEEVAISAPQVDIK